MAAILKICPDIEVAHGEGRALATWSATGRVPELWQCHDAFGALLMEAIPDETPLSEALRAILCDADTEVVARRGDGRYMEYGSRQRTAPPALKRALLAKYNHTCGADGCTSQHRLRIHRLTPWSEGGETSKEDLVVLCWFHHHVIVHERGYEIYYHHDPRRIRFRKPTGRRRPS